MIEDTWLVFIIASLVLIVTPGQDMILVMSRSIAAQVSYPVPEYRLPPCKLSPRFAPV